MMKADKLRGCLTGLFIGDALAMPIHWYYDVMNIKNDFGEGGITKYESPKEKVVGSYMNISDADRDLIGKVMLHDKLPCYEKGRGAHYHHGMKPGENTLDTIIARLLLESTNTDSAEGYGVDGEEFLNKYITLFTTPGAHNDSYAAGAHRAFFRNWVKKDRPNSECGDSTDTMIDALANIVVLAAARYASTGHKAKESDASVVASTIGLLRNSPDVLPKYGCLFFDLLLRVLSGEVSLRAAVLESADKLDPSGELSSTIKSTPADPMVPCPIEKSYPALLHFAYKYGEGTNSFRTALLASANAGGENVNRGSCLGALLGASVGFDAISKENPDLVGGLVDVNIAKETDGFLKRFGVE
eukprot:TRINITY_DN10090_c0_g1_i1.p1 TRINITY_DN10090_c0_g1~~TRINITY_DN10090_c0_g1_i1.p1  ORF type:complete len:357 (+),score=51.68 TRINITY_DN10090_c0_g1_i1:49-1119(+)